MIISTEVDVRLFFRSIFIDPVVQVRNHDAEHVVCKPIIDGSHHTTVVLPTTVTEVVLTESQSSVPADSKVTDTGKVHWVLPVKYNYKSYC